MSYKDKRLIISQLKKDISYEEVIYNITKIKDVKYLLDNLKTLQVYKNNKVLEIPLQMYFNLDPICFNLNIFLTLNKNTVLYKIGSIIYHWICSVGCSIKYTYEDILCSQEEYLLSCIEDANDYDIDYVLEQQEALNDYIKEKQSAFELHDSLIRYYDKLNLKDSKGRSYLRKKMVSHPQYTSLIASFLSLISVKFNIHKNYLMLVKNEDIDLVPFSFIYSETLDDYCNDILNNYNYYYIAYGKKRKVFERLNAFINKLNEVNQ